MRMTHRRQPGHTAGGTLASLSRHPHACPTHECKQCHTAGARWQGRRKQAGCTFADEGSRRITGSMEAEWTEPTRRGPPPLSSSAARSSVLADAVHEGCRGGRCKPDGLMARWSLCRHRRCLDRGSIPSRARCNFFAFFDPPYIVWRLHQKYGSME